MKKESTASKKTSKKTTKSYKVVVDLTKAETPADVYDAFIEAKIKAGMPITEVEMTRAKAHIVEMMLDAIDSVILEYDENVRMINDDELAKDLIKLINKHVGKKEPWYKKVWNWIKKPFTKKK